MQKIIEGHYNEKREKKSEVRSGYV
jgi:hypothetical protein